MTVRFVILLKNSLMKHNHHTDFQFRVIAHDGTTSRGTERAVL